MPQTTQQMRDEQAKVEGALDLYCDWLNALGKAEHDSFKPETQAEYPFHPFKTSDFTKGEFGELRTVARYEMDGMEVYALEVGNGDDGGPAYVTLYFEPAYEPLPEGPFGMNGGPAFLRHATQQFDGRMSLWFEDGKPVKP